MFKNKFHKTIKAARGHSLSEKEKMQMKASLLDHMAENPPIAEVMWKGEGSPILSYFNFNTLGRYTLPVTALVLIISVSTSAFASNYALPGDLLYPVKILNEKLELSLAITDEAQEKIDTEHAIVRLEEAETLQARGKLDEDKKAALSDSFKRSQRKATPEGRNNFLKKLRPSLRSIAVTIDPSFINSSSESDHKTKDNQREDRDDYRVAKKKEDNKATATMAASISTSSASTSPAAPSIQIPAETEPHQ